MKIILGSGSPRRKELLQQIGLDFDVVVSRCEEKITSVEPCKVVEELSFQKAMSVAKQITGSMSEISRNADGESDCKESSEYLVIGADTVVALKQKIFGKPADRLEAESMIASIQGGSHHVYTGVTLILIRDGEIVNTRSFHEATRVDLYPMENREIQEYLDMQEWTDKAGAYAIQGYFARYIRGIEGDYNNVVGLPVARLYQEMKEIGKMKKAIIFDLDGTLSDSIHSIKYSCDLALEKYGYGPFSVEDYKYFVGDGAANLVKRALIAGGDEKLENFDAAFDDYKSIFGENCMYQVKPYDGITELLKALKERNVKLAVLSNKPHNETIRVIHDLFGENVFDVIQGQTDDIPIKPSPEGVFRIMKKLKLDASDLMYLGDTATDMKTGKGAGAFTIGALWGFRKKEELVKNGADALVAHPLEVLKYL